MARYVNEAIPFQTLGNRQVLTDLQICTMPWLEDFIGRFRHCFERDEARCLWIYAP